MGSLLTLRPGHARLPDLTPLPDGRYRLTVYQKLPAAHYVAPEYGTLYDDTLTGDELARYSGLRLINIDPGNERYKPSVPSVTLVYEQLHATLETQVGKLTTVTDENDREVLQAQFIQFSSAAYVKGVIGTLTPPGVTTAVLDGESSTDEGILRKITRKYVQAGATFTSIGEDEIDYELNGLKRRVRNLVARGGVAFTGTVGATTHPTDTGLILAGLSIRESAATTKVKGTYLQPGITDAEKKSDSDAGLLYVTFRSWHTKIVPTCLKSGSSLNDDPTVAFQGGAAAQIYRDRIENVKGFRTHTVTVMMKINGSALSTGVDQLVNSYNRYIKYTRPGVLDIDTDSDSAKGWGFVGYPGAEKEPLALVEEYLSTLSTLDGSFAPFSVTQWASAFLSYDQDGEVGTVSKSANGYLGGAEGAATGNPTYAYAISSDPSMAAFLEMNDTVVASSNGPAFITDEGVRWYKKTRISIPGTLADALA